MRFWVVGPCPGCREGDDENDSAKLPDPLEMQTALARCGIEWDTDFDSPEFYTWAVTGLESGGESADSCYDAIQRMLTAKDPDDFSGGDAPATAPELMFWRWAYGLNLVAAKQALELRKIEQRAAGEEKNWPGQQEWSDLVGTSHSVFLREARELAGIDHETFLAFARNQHGSAFAEIADELYDAALKPTARAALLTPSEIGESE